MVDPSNRGRKYKLSTQPVQDPLGQFPSHSPPRNRQRGNSNRMTIHADK
ncbi:hypothetical protein FHL01_06600 [Cylindrospermopsis raciborskii CS-506_C]|nr:hypothetical protein [Cylindrospermopsis raciborskii CS-506_C]